MKNLTYLTAGALTLLAGHALAAGGDIGDAAKQDTNWTAIVIAIGERRSSGTRLEHATPIRASGFV